MTEKDCHSSRSTIEEQVEDWSDVRSQYGASMYQYGCVKVELAVFGMYSVVPRRRHPLQSAFPSSFLQHCKLRSVKNQLRIDLSRRSSHPTFT